jgi:hypothetical protein
MRRVAPTVGIQDGRHLSHGQSLIGGADNHFAGEFHSRGAQVKGQDCIPAESAKAAVEITDLIARQNPPEEAQNGFPIQRFFSGIAPGLIPPGTGCR